MILKDFLELIDNTTKIIIQDRNDNILTNDFCKTKKYNIKKCFKQLEYRIINFLYAPNKDTIKIFIH